MPCSVKDIHDIDTLCRRMDILSSFAFLISIHVFLFTQFSILHAVGLRQTFKKETVSSLYRVQKMKQSEYSHGILRIFLAV